MSVSSSCREEEGALTTAGIWEPIKDILAPGIQLLRAPISPQQPPLTDTGDHGTSQTKKKVYTSFLHRLSSRVLVIGVGGEYDLPAQGQADAAIRPMLTPRSKSVLCSMPAQLN